MKPESKGKKPRSLLFILSFMIAMILFLGSVGSVMMWGGTLGNLARQESSQTKSQSYQPDPEQSLTVLLIGCRDRESAAGAFMLLQVDAQRSKIRVAALPPETVATVNIKTDTLSGFYDYGGALMAEEAVQNAYGVYINRYVRVNMKAFSSLINLVGGVEYAPPYQTVFQIGNPGEAQLMDGSRAYALFTAKTEDDLDRIHTQTAFAGAFLRQNFTPAKVRTFQSIFELVTGQMDTDLTRYDFEFRQELLAYLAEKENQIEEFLVEGEYTSEGFVPELSKLQAFQMKSEEDQPQ